MSGRCGRKWTLGKGNLKGENLRERVGLVRRVETAVGVRPVYNREGKKGSNGMNVR